MMAKHTSKYHIKYCFRYDSVNYQKLLYSIYKQYYQNEILMNKQRKQHADIYDENVFANPSSGKSPIQRNMYHQYTNIGKSPIRSRTPNKPVSPAKAYHQMPSNIRYIANVSPLKERSNQVENYIQLSNGKNVRYIHGHKMERNYQTTKKNQYNRHSQRVFQQQHRLFGKLVDKLNSEKKAPPRSNQVSNKTSFHTQNSDIKPNKVDPSLRPSGTFKHLISQVKIGQTKSQIKPHSRGKEFDLPNQGETENLSCLVYRVKNPINESNMVQRSNNSQINNHYSSIIRKKPSKTQCLPDYRDEPTKNNNFLIQQQDEYKQLDILLGKIQQGKGKQPTNTHEEYLVKMSLQVKESLSMDPFI